MSDRDSSPVPYVLVEPAVEVLGRVMTELAQRIDDYEVDSLLEPHPTKARVALHRADAMREARRVVELELDEVRLAQ